jgi:hypothetical protein
MRDSFRGCEFRGAVSAMRWRPPAPPLLLDDAVEPGDEPGDRAEGDERAVAHLAAALDVDGAHAGGESAQPLPQRLDGVGRARAPGDTSIRLPSGSRT